MNFPSLDQQGYLRPLIIILILGGIFFMHCIGFFGHFGYDDIYYARIAHAITNGNFNPGNDLYAFRWGIVYPITLFYLIFGVNDFSSSLPAFIATGLTLFLIHRISRTETLLVFILTVTVFIFHSWTFFYSDKLMPDSLIAFAFTGMIWVLFELNFGQFSKKYIPAAFSFVLFFLFAFITKETFILFLPVILSLFIIDLVNKRNLKFWIYSFLISATLLSLYFLCIKIISGNPWQRWEALKAGAYINDFSYDHLPKSVLQKRITTGLINVWMQSGFCWLLIFCIPSIWKLFSEKKYFSLNSPERFFTFLSIMVILSCNFMTISFSAYVPLGPDPRHYLFAVPLIAILSGRNIASLIAENKFRSLIILLALACVYSYYMNTENKYYTFLSVTLFFFVVALFHQFKFNINPKWFAVALLLLLLQIPFQFYLQSKTTGYSIQKNLIQDFSKHSSVTKYIFTDEVQANYGEYNLSFDTSRIHFIPFNKYEIEKFSCDSNHYVLLNGFTLYQSSFDWNNMPDTLNKIASKGKVIFENGAIKLIQCR